MKKKEIKEESKIINKIDMDNGYFPYAQDIGRVLAKTYLNGSHRGILDCIFSKTFGYPDKKSNKIEKIKRRVIEERITCREFGDFTRIKRNHISKYILELVTWKIIKRRKRGQYYLYSFNVTVSQWNKGIFERTVPQTRDTLNCPTNEGQSVPQTRDTKNRERGTLEESETGEKVNKDKALQGIQKSPNKLLKKLIKKAKAEPADIRELKEGLKNLNFSDQEIEGLLISNTPDQIRNKLKALESRQGIRNPKSYFIKILKADYPNRDIPVKSEKEDQGDFNIEDWVSEKDPLPLEKRKKEMRKIAKLAGEAAKKLKRGEI